MRAVSQEAGDLRIEELSERSQVSVRNIREYQDRGLLPAPQRDGRIALYNGDHLVRLELITHLLARGYTLAVIRELLDAWAGGRDLHDVLGLESAATRPWGKDQPITLSGAELQQICQDRLSAEDLGCLTQARILIPSGPDYFCPQQGLLQGVAELLDAGIPIPAGTAMVERVRPHLTAVAENMVALVADALLPPDTPTGLPEGIRLAQVAASVERLRPVADAVAAALFANAMQDAVEGAVNLIASRALQTRRGTTPTAG